MVTELGANSAPKALKVIPSVLFSTGVDSLSLLQEEAINNSTIANDIVVLVNLNIVLFMCKVIKIMVSTIRHYLCLHSDL
ncbi:hypothetical protein D3C73_1435500 [compost metagenome]